jgi:hypothetical protein
MAVSDGNIVFATQVILISGKLLLINQTEGEAYSVSFL